MKHLLITGGAGFIGSNLVLALQRKFPKAKLVIIDDFRSGDFRNLQGYRGDFVAADISRLDWDAQFKDAAFDAIFHEASITDTTIHDQWLQTHDNVEGFRRLLDFASRHLTPVIYASSAATYGIAGRKMAETQPAAPANVYAFSKVQLDNLARLYSKKYPSWFIVGLRYFNVYGPREAHKKAAASMIYQLYLQMRAGKQPRVFREGEQKRDFVYIDDVVELTIRALWAPESTVYNCGSGQAASFNQVIAELNNNLGTALPPDYFENPYPFYQPFTQADMTRAKSELDYRPRYTLASGIAKYVAFLEGRKKTSGL